MVKEGKSEIQADDYVSAAVDFSKDQRLGQQASTSFSHLEGPLATGALSSRGARKYGVRRLKSRSSSVTLT